MHDVRKDDGHRTDKREKKEWEFKMSLARIANAQHISTTIRRQPWHKNQEEKLPSLLL
jgi:hypothetical protein